MNKSKQKGFTLIELLVVVVIIAILALIVLLAINPVEMARKSRDSRRLSDVGTLRRAIDLALTDGNNGTLPAGKVNINVSTSVTEFPSVGGLNISKYLSAVPQDPSINSTSIQLIGAPSGGVCTGANGSPVNYSFWSDGSVYVIRTRLESTENCAALMSDGNNDNAFYEIGTDPGLDGGE